MYQVEVEIPDNKVDDFHRMRAFFNYVTSERLVINALAITDWVIKEIEKGRDVASVDEANQTYKVVDITGLIKG